MFYDSSFQGWAAHTMRKHWCFWEERQISALLYLFEHIQCSKAARLTYALPIKWDSKRTFPSLSICWNGDAFFTLVRGAFKIQTRKCFSRQAHKNKSNSILEFYRQEFPCHGAGHASLQAPPLTPLFFVANLYRGLCAPGSMNDCPL